MFWFIIFSSLDTSAFKRGPLLVGCPWILIRCIGNYPLYWRSFLHLQPENAPCRDDRTHLSWMIFINSFLKYNTLYILPVLVTFLTKNYWCSEFLIIRRFWRTVFPGLVELKCIFCLNNCYCLQSLKNNIPKPTTNISTRKLRRVSRSISRSWRLILHDCSMR